MSRTIEALPQFSNPTSGNVKDHWSNVQPSAPRATMTRTVLQKLCRLYPLLSGCTQIANCKLLRGMTSENELAVTTLRDGSVIRLQLNDYGGRSMYFFGDYDPKITRILNRILRPGDNVVDIGANFGLISLLSANLVGNRGAVHAFEPQVDLAALVESSASDNEYDQLVVHPIALSDQDGDVQMFVSPGVTGAASLVRDDLAGVQRQTIRAAAAGPYLDDLNLGQVRLLKIDVEGHEFTVLSAAEDWLHRIRPDAILFETQDYDVALRDRPVVNLLSQLGYQFFPIGKSRIRMKLVKDSETPKQIRDHAHDVLAIHPDSDCKI